MLKYQRVQWSSIFCGRFETLFLANFSVSIMCWDKTTYLTMPQLIYWVYPVMPTCIYLFTITLQFKLKQDLYLYVLHFWDDNDKDIRRCDYCIKKYFTAKSWKVGFNRPSALKITELRILYNANTLQTIIK